MGCMSVCIPRGVRRPRYKILMYLRTFRKYSFYPMGLFPSLLLPTTTTILCTMYYVLLLLLLLLNKCIFRKDEYEMENSARGMNFSLQLIPRAVSGSHFMLIFESGVGKKQQDAVFPEVASGVSTAVG